MLFTGTFKDEDIIHVAKNAFLPYKKGTHLLLEEFRSTAGAKREALEKVSPEWCDKGGQLLASFTQVNLPESAVGIELAKQDSI